MCKREKFNRERSGTRTSGRSSRGSRRRCPSCSHRGLCRSNHGQLRFQSPSTRQIQMGIQLKKIQIGRQEKYKLQPKRLTEVRELTQRAIRSSSAQIAHASNVLIGIPWGSVCSTSLSSELIFCEAYSSVVAVVGADSSFASNSFIVSKASAFTSGSITSSFIRAFYGGMCVVGVYYVSDPCFIPMQNIFF